jgi:hypothetical protein
MSNFIRLFSCMGLAKERDVRKVYYKGFKTLANSKSLRRIDDLGAGMWHN